MFDRIFEETTYYIHQGGIIMWPLVIATFLLWYALGYRFYILRRGNPRSVRVLVQKYLSGYERKPSGIIDTAVVRATRLAKQSRENLRSFLDDDFSQFVHEIGKFSILVRAIVIVAPLIGLLGTVSGMIEMFDSLAENTFYSQSGGIARGIATALFTTQLGLAVAVPGMIIGRILEKRQRVLERELDQIKDIMCSGQMEGNK
jgi:biopolymer transport protein ExbB